MVAGRADNVFDRVAVSRALTVHDEVEAFFAADVLDKVCAGVAVVENLERRSDAGFSVVADIAFHAFAGIAVFAYDFEFAEVKLAAFEVAVILENVNVVVVRTVYDHQEIVVTGSEIVFFLGVELKFVPDNGLFVFHQKEHDVRALNIVALDVDP